MLHTIFMEVPMRFYDLFLLGLGLSMDAFAVAVCKGLAIDRLTWRHMAVVGGWFGAFQALMPLTGYLLGSAFQDYIAAVDHWIVFLLLALIGGDMIAESFSAGESQNSALTVKVMLPMALATSVDALAVGITFGLLRGVSIWTAVAVIGMTTFCLSALGVKVGNVFGSRYSANAERLGGVILILLGVKILVEHLAL